MTSHLQGNATQPAFQVDTSEAKINAFRGHHHVMMVVREPKGIYIYIYIYFLSIPFIIFALPSFSLPSRNSDPGSQSRLLSLLPHYGSCFAFLSREDFSTFFPRQLSSNFAYPRYNLRSRQSVSFENKNLHGENRTLDIRPYRLRGYQLDHRGDRH